ncbi:MAG: hypothetical protein BV459_00325 [Thermoplasmata archaeon M11B2D]|nr:MAG: hypothetical protein BV459_00325 [Thermoplasmata archaeon M11B2D]
MSFGKELIKHIEERNFTDFADMLSEKLFDEISVLIDEEREFETNKLQEAIRRLNRVRKGKIQRNVRVSDKAGFTIRGGKEVRLKATERRKRRLARRIANKKIKRKLRTGTSKIKRKRSVIKSRRLSNSSATRRALSAKRKKLRGRR